MRSYLKGKLAALVLKTEINGRGEPPLCPLDITLSGKVCTKIRRSLNRYSSLADEKQRSFFLIIEMSQGLNSLREAQQEITKVMLRIPHSLDNWLIDGGEIVSLTH
jgi:hypothetical protein